MQKKQEKPTASGDQPNKRKESPLCDSIPGLLITIQGVVHPSLNQWTHWHWSKVNREKKRYNEEIGWLVIGAGWRNKRLQSARVTIDYYFGNKQRRDKDNYTPKFIMDALVNVGVIEDDNDSAIWLKWNLHNEGPKRTEIRVEPEGSVLTE